MRTLHIDIETRSPEPIATSGMYRYALSRDFRIFLFAYAYGDGGVRVLDLTKEELPEQIIRDILDPKVLKVAHNAAFERVCLSVYLRGKSLLPADGWLDASSWFCTMVQAVRCGYPASLAQAGAALGLRDQKMTEGKNLIKLFCTPHVPDMLRGEWTEPSECPEEWATFIEYCKRDVEVEKQIYRRLQWHTVPASEQALYALDQRINDRGVLVDVDMAAQAARMGSAIKARLQREAIELTGLSNPNSVRQLKVWVGERLGRTFDTLRKADVSELMGSTGDDTVDRVLRIRQEMGKSSCAKYTAMLNCVCSDCRARGLTQFYGSRTGRWAGRLLQLQNLPQNHIAELDFARRCLKDGDYDTLELCFGNVPDTMSQLIRTALIAPSGKTLAVCDFSAIEARVLAWLAGETWVLDTFREGKDIYCATASQMFHVPVEKHGQNSELRQKGKIAVLALGYAGGVGALDAMGGQKMGMSAEEEQETVDKWRKANPNIVTLWHDVQDAAVCAVTYRKAYVIGNKLRFRMEDGTLCIDLPSGRTLCYPDMQYTSKGNDRYEHIDQTAKQAACSPDFTIHRKLERLRFMGMNQTTKKWEWVETRGGKLVENITQAVARDLLAHVMMQVESTTDAQILFHVHDEVVCEVPDEGCLKDIQEAFAKGPEWAEGLPLKGAGYTGKYYFKD